MGCASGLWIAEVGLSDRGMEMDECRSQQRMMLNNDLKEEDDVMGMEKDGKVSRDTHKELVLA